jgi:hypothetical protein
MFVSKVYLLIFSCKCIVDAQYYMSTTLVVYIFHLFFKIWIGERSIFILAWLAGPFLCTPYVCREWLEHVGVWYMHYEIYATPDRIWREIGIGLKEEKDTYRVYLHLTWTNFFWTGTWTLLNLTWLTKEISHFFSFST